jgi:UDP:flavonoid glycosyltransferase YjiC (YdhE family)
MRTRRALLVSWGNGSGHITRVVDLADRARAEGWDVTIVTRSHPLHLDLIGRYGYPVIRFPDELVPVDPWTCWADSGFLEDSIDWDRRLITSIEPDLVIHDNRVATMIAAAESGTNYASVCQQTHLPGFEYPGLGTETIWTEPIPAVSARLRKSTLPPLEADIRELYLRGRILLPSIPEIDPIPDRLATRDVVHIGPLRARGAARPSRPAGPTRPASGKGVFFYRTVGPGTDFEQFVAAFGDIADRVHLATSDPAMTELLRNQLAGQPFHIATFTDVDELRPRLGAAVTHGGHGISLTCISLALPAVVLPGNNPERNLNGRALAACGFGRVLGVGASFSINWAASVDVTGHVPSWQAVRAEVDALAGTELPPRALAIADRVNTELVTASFAKMLGLERT